VTTSWTRHISSEISCCQPPTSRIVLGLSPIVHTEIVVIRIGRLAPARCILLTPCFPHRGPSRELANRPVHISRGPGRSPIVSRGPPRSSLRAWRSRSSSTLAGRSTRSPAARSAAPITLAEHYDPPVLKLQAVSGPDSQWRRCASSVAIRTDSRDLVLWAGETQRSMVLKELGPSVARPSAPAVGIVAHGLRDPLTDSRDPDRSVLPATNVRSAQPLLPPREPAPDDSPRDVPPKDGRDLNARPDTTARAAILSIALPSVHVPGSGRSRAGGSRRKASCHAD
jgi:hypothetical protein